MAQGAWAQPLFELRLAPHRLPLAQATCRAYVCEMLSKSRFNPGPGLIDFWHEFRKPNPYRWPILAVSAVPVGAVLLWFFNDIYYADPARPEVTYITSYAPDRSDAEIEHRTAFWILAALFHIPFYLFLLHRSWQWVRGRGALAAPRLGENRRAFSSVG